ncbi:MAG TPA: serine/threonine protein phosphatase, partial [Planctomycetaceae bacterium]|nr:serine/threonine protein phosphatase [Planctomycetaceae bacterium]
MRTIAIGDIHGCCKALEALLAAIKPRPTDTIVFLGDYIDRGPDSRGVLDVCMQVSQRCHTVFLLGNHEVMLQGVLRGLSAEHWLQSGGKQTVTSFGGRLESIAPKYQNFLSKCVHYYETATHIFVHANFHADIPLRRQPEESLFWEHLSDRVPDPHFSGKHVILGHTPQQNGNIGWYGHFTCIDTGCFAGGFLTALDVDSLEYWQA